MTCPLRSAADVGQRSECAMVMSVTTQTFFPYMSDAHRPAVDVQMAAQDACVPLSFWLILSAILIDGDGYTLALQHSFLQPAAGRRLACRKDAARAVPT